MKLPDIEYMKLYSAEKHEFIIGRNAISLCPGLIKVVEEAQSAEEGIVLYETSYKQDILKVVLEYLHYKLRYIAQKDYQHIPEFKMEPIKAVEILKVAMDLGL